MKPALLSACSLSFLPTFEKGVLRSLEDPRGECAIEPDYATVVDLGKMRRMGRIIRMAAATAVQAAEDRKPDSIIVGSGLGCYTNAILFTEEFLTKKDGLLSPQYFVQSTENVIAGQIALLLDAQGYNITYSQKGVSFENAMMDGMLRYSEGRSLHLVGGVDEKYPGFSLGGTPSGLWIGEGASFFLLGDPSPKNNVLLDSCQIFPIKDFPADLIRQLEKDLRPDTILYGDSFIHGYEDECLHEFKTMTRYSDHCGIYMTNMGFGVHWGKELIEAGNNCVVIVNNFYNKHAGVIVLRSGT